MTASSLKKQVSLLMIAGEGRSMTSTEAVRALAELGEVPGKAKVDQVIAKIVSGLITEERVICEAFEKEIEENWESPDFSIEDFVDDFQRQLSAKDCKVHEILRCYKTWLERGIKQQTLLESLLSYCEKKNIELVENEVAKDQ